MLNNIENKRRNVLRWLSKVDYGAHHEKARDLRFDDTGGWLFGKREFEDWVESQCSSVLWVCGTGKESSHRRKYQELIVAN